MEVTRSTWLDESEDHELVRELLDDQSPLFFLPEETIQSTPSNRNEQTINQLVLTSYSGPTIQDMENALSMTSQKDQPQSASHGFSMWERGSKIEDNKYTLKLKCCDNGMADDGYKWRKYGQKSIKNSPYPRSYYRCTNPRCSAKKQVERCKEEEDTVVITYEGFHLHFAYPYFLLNQSSLLNSPVKKSKKTISESQSVFQGHEFEKRAQEGAQGSPYDGPFTMVQNNQEQEMGLERMDPQGLLEDVVPFMVRNPSNNNAYSTTSCSSYRSSPISPSSLSRSSNQTYFLY